MKRLVPFFVAGLVGCDGDSGVPEFPRGCDESTIDGDCRLFVGASYTESGIEALCGGDIVDACPAGELGQCTLFEGTVDELVGYFYPRFWTGTQAADRCLVDGGTWTGS